jgi:hypothetical protein
MSSSGTESDRSEAGPTPATIVKVKKPCSPERLALLAGLREKALAKRLELKVLREKEIAAKRMKEAAQLNRRKMTAEAELAEATQECNAVAAMKATKPVKLVKKVEDRGDSESSSSAGEPPPSRRRKSVRVDLEDKVRDLELSLAKMKYKWKFSQNKIQQPVVVNTSTPTPKSDLSQAASDALQKQLQYTVQGFGAPRLF